MNTRNLPRKPNAAPVESARPFPDHPKVGVPLKVAIVYDGIPAGRRAFQTVKRMLDQAGEPMHVYPAIWRFDLLDDPECRSLATSDAADADMLILAMEGPRVLPPGVDYWLSDFLFRHRGSPITILAMWGREEEWTISLYERNEHGRMKPTQSSLSARATVRVSGNSVNPFASVVAAA